jgi:ankyrin repeat protein
MFTSRPEGYIRDAVGSLGIPSLDLDCDGINRDIEACVSESLAKDVRFIRTPQEGKDLIRESLTSRAGGMYVPLTTPLLDNILNNDRFRWVALQLDAVSRCHSLNTLRFALSSLPRSLEETYRRILDSIAEEEVPHVRRILQWLCFSKRPLRIEEIALVYQISDNILASFKTDDELFHLEDSMDICRGLLSSSLIHTLGVKYGEWRHFPPSITLRIVQLAHFSVKEYLLSSQCSAIWALDESLSHVTILKGVITYYLHFMTLRDLHSLPGPDLAVKYSLAEYFVQCVPAHLSPVREHPDLLPLLHRLLHPPSTPFDNRLGWCLVDPWHHCSAKYGGLDRFGSHDPALNLLVAIRLRLPQVCESLLAMNIHPHLAEPILKHRHLHPPLIQAATLGCTEIVRVLLASRYHGVDPLVSAMEWAAKGGNTQVVRMLLEAGGDIKEPPGRFEKSLHHAISSDRKEIALAILNSGVDVNACNGEALTLALARGHTELVPKLVAAGVDVNAGKGWAICYASNRGQEAVVRMLVEAGADVNLTNDGQPTALQAASCLGYTKIVEMLVAAGAQVNSGNGRALLDALARGHEAVVHALIEAGACVNLDEGYALQMASCQGYTEMIQMLVTAGAKVTSVNGQALWAASAHGHEEVVHALIEAGVCVNLDEEYASQMASCQGYTEMIQMLITAGAKVTSGNGQALWAASARGHEEVVHALIEAGANVDVRGNRNAHNYGGATALQTAAHLGYTKIVQMLITAGAQIDSEALRAASARGHEEVVRLLIDAGANVDLNGATLETAAFWGYTKIVQKLIAAGAQVNSGDGRALWYASARGHEEVVHALIEAGANVNLKHMGQTALHNAELHQHPKIVQMLKDAGARMY